MSQTATLTVTYAGDAYNASATSARLALEQEPVADSKLTTNDLTVMLALVRSGVSAKAYIPASCPASVVDGQVICPIDVWVWPSPGNLAYTLTANQGSLGERIRVEMEREFDLVINFERTVQLPFDTTSLSWEWSVMPCLDSNSQPVAVAPNVTATSSTISVDADVIGVLRVKCMAVGWLHTLVLRFAKGDATITNIDVVVTAQWESGGENQTARLPIELPGCLKTLLETCDDGELKYERGMGAVRYPNETYAVVYYSECNGHKLALRYEKARS